MSLRERIESDMKQAMLDRDTVARDTLRMVLAGLKNRRIELGEDLDEDQETAVLQSCVKTRRDSVEQYEHAGRGDLAAKEGAEIEVIARYLPEMLSPEKTRAEAEALVAELGLEGRRDFGKLMKTMKERHGVVLDMGVLKDIAGELLG